MVQQQSHTPADEMVNLIVQSQSDKNNSNDGMNASLQQNMEILSCWMEDLFFHIQQIPNSCRHMLPSYITSYMFPCMHERAYFCSFNTCQTGQEVSFYYCHLHTEVVQEYCAVKGLLNLMDWGTLSTYYDHSLARWALSFFHHRPDLMPC